MPKLPTPPIPPQLLPQPPRPGTQRGRPRTPLEKGAEAGKSVVDWVDERTSLSGGVRSVSYTHLTLPTILRV